MKQNTNKQVHEFKAVLHRTASKPGGKNIKAKTVMSKLNETEILALAKKKGLNISPALIKKALGDPATAALIKENKTNAFFNRIQKDVKKVNKVVKQVNKFDKKEGKAKFSDIRNAANSYMKLLIKDNETTTGSKESKHVLSVLTPMVKSNLRMLKMVAKLPDWMVADSNQQIINDIILLETAVKEMSISNGLSALRVVLRPMRSYLFASMPLDFEPGLKLKSEALVSRYQAEAAKDVISAEKGRPEPDTTVFPVVPVLHFSTPFITRWAEELGVTFKELNDLINGSNGQGKFYALSGVSHTTGAIQYETVEYGANSPVGEQVHAQEIYKPMYDEILQLTREINSALISNRPKAYDKYDGMTTVKLIISMIFDTYGRVIMEQGGDIIEQVITNIAKTTNNMQAASLKDLGVILALVSDKTLQKTINAAEKSLSMYEWNTLPKLYAFMKNVFRAYVQRFDSKIVNYYIAGAQIGTHEYSNVALPVLALPFTDEILADGDNKVDLGDSFFLDQNTLDYAKEFNVVFKSAFIEMIRGAKKNMAAGVAPTTAGGTDHKGIDAFAVDPRFTMMPTPVYANSKTILKSIDRWDSTVTIDDGDFGVHVAGLFTGKRDNTIIDGLFEEYNYSGVYKLLQLLPGTLSHNDQVWMVNRKRFFQQLGIKLERWQSVLNAPKPALAAEWKGLTDWLTKLPTNFRGVAFVMKGNTKATAKYYISEPLTLNFDSKGAVTQLVVNDRKTIDKYTKEKLHELAWRENISLNGTTNNYTVEDLVSTKPEEAIGINIMNDIANSSARRFFRPRYPQIFLTVKTAAGEYIDGMDAVVYTTQSTTGSEDLMKFKSNILNDDQGIMKLWTKDQFIDLDTVKPVMDFIFGTAKTASRAGSTVTVLNTADLLAKQSGFSLTDSLKAGGWDAALQAYAARHNLPTLQVGGTATSSSVFTAQLGRNVSIDAKLLATELLDLTTKVIDYTEKGL